MSFASSVANLFRPTTQVVAAPANQPAPPMSQQNPGAGAGAPPAGTSQPVTDPTPPNPLDSFSTVWQTPTTDPNAVDPMAAPLLNTDPNKIAAAAAKMDFTTGISPEAVQAAMQDPIKFLQLLNQVGQRALATATQVSTATVEQATARNNERLNQALPSRIRTTQIESMQSENPVLQHPAAQPLLHLVRSNIARNDPNLSPQQVLARAEQYLTSFATSLTQPAADAATAAANPPGQDWDLFLSDSQ